ncbi:MAG: hypothetical protein ACHQT8_02135 [Chlamydiales bacterium]
MAGVAKVSVTKMLENPTMIPGLARGAEVRSSDLLLQPRGRVELDAIINELYRNRRKIHVTEGEKALSLIKTPPCSACLPTEEMQRTVLKEICQFAQTKGLTFAHIPIKKVQSPLFEKISKIADEIGFTPDEKAFIQYQVIGGREHIFVGEDHCNKKFRELKYRLLELAVNREMAFFLEPLCRDTRSEQDYFDFCLTAFATDNNSGKPAWIFGLEGAVRPLEQAFLSCLLNPDFHATQPTKSVNAARACSAENQSLISAENYEMYSSTQLNFLIEVLYNSPWEMVFSKMNGKTRGAVFSPDAARLCVDIMKAWSVPLGLSEKEKQLFLPLIQNYSLKVWREFFFKIAQFSFNQPEIANLLSSAEKMVMQSALENLQSKEAWDLFLDTIGGDRRDRDFGHALFSTELPPGTVRVAQCGFSHVPGAVRELERLAAENARAPREKNDKKK